MAIYSITTSASSSMTLWPALTQMAVTLPSFSASMLFAIFMASNTSSVSPALTSSPTFTLIEVMVPGSGAFIALAVFTFAVAVVYCVQT